MLNKIAESVVRFRWIIVFIFAGVTALAATVLPQTEIEPALKKMLPDDIPSRVNLDKIESLFGGNEMVIAVLSSDDVLDPLTLERTKKITREMEKVKEFDRVISLFTLKEIKGEAGQMIVNPAVKRIPRSDSQRKKLGRDLKDNDMVYGSVVSKDFKHTAIIGFLNFKATDAEALSKVNSIIANNPGPEKVVIGGMPFIRTNVGRDMRADVKRLLPFGLIIMLVFLYICFRQIRGVILPAVTTVMGIIVGVSCISLLGWKFHMVTLILPVFLIAVANDYGIHILARYQEDNRPNQDMSSFELARSGVLALARPILATALTTVVGLLCLLTHVVVPARQVGVLASIGVVYALLGSLLFIPAVLAILPKAKPVLAEPSDGTAKLTLLDRLLHRTATMTTQHPKAILGVVVALVFPVAFGIRFLVVDTDPVHYYPKDAPVAISADIINRNFGGSSSVSVVAEGDIKDPSIMKSIDALEQYLSAHPNVDTTASISRVVRKMNEVMHDGDKQYDRIPETRDEIAQYFLLYSMSGDPDDFDKLVDFPYQHAQINARINDSSTSVATEMIRYVEEYVKGLENSPFTIIGGFAALFSELVTHIVWGQVTSLLLSIVLVSCLVGILFKSWTAIILSGIPLTCAMLLLFGLMGYFNIELNVVTAMLSSIMIGVGVDYTIHFLWRYRDERKAGNEPLNAIKTTLTTSGRGIVFNALSVVIGFAVLLISAFLPIQFFGFLVLVSITACLLGALVILPAICLVLKPKFLEY